MYNLEEMWWDIMSNQKFARLGASALGALVQLEGGVGGPQAGVPLHEHLGWVCGALWVPGLGEERFTPSFSWPSIEFLSGSHIYSSGVAVIF